jgi:hypothetical protein
MVAPINSSVGKVQAPTSQGYTMLLQSGSPFFIAFDAFAGSEVAIVV